MTVNFDGLAEEIGALHPRIRRGRVSSVSATSIRLKGMANALRIGDLVRFGDDDSVENLSEVVALSETETIVSPYFPALLPAVGAPAQKAADFQLRPSSAWIGRVIDAFGRPLDGRPLSRNAPPQPLHRRPPPARERTPLNHRLNTSFAVLDTLLPLARGQRIGVFAGSGVGKTTLLTQLAKHLEADCAVICLVGERGRELNEFIEKGLGEDGLARSVVVVATSDQSALVKRRAAFTATTVAEGFRDSGKNVLLILDSITRFAEAHREVALVAGEAPSLRAFPPSTSGVIAGLTERTGMGGKGQGDITAIYSVLVAGSDMEEPIADITRGLLDGHIVLDRAIAERGRFPAIDVLRSVSRSLPDIAGTEENELISETRRILNTYETAEALIQTGLYSEGSDPEIDRAIELWPQIDAFIKLQGMETVESSFSHLARLLVRDEVSDET